MIVHDSQNDNKPFILGLFVHSSMSNIQAIFNVLYPWKAHHWSIQSLTAADWFMTNSDCQSLVYGKNHTKKFSLTQEERMSFSVLIPWQYEEDLSKLVKTHSLPLNVKYPNSRRSWQFPLCLRLTLKQLRLVHPIYITFNLYDWSLYLLN